MSEIETKIHGATQTHTDIDSYQQTAGMLVEILKRFL
jgi:hypothetical protein